MDHKQLRRSKKLIRKLCCNYDHGNCLAPGGEQNFRTGDGLVGLHQLIQHGSDPVHEAVRGDFAALDLFQAVPPFGGELR